MTLVSENTLVINSSEEGKLRDLLSQKDINISHLKQVYNKNNIIIYTFDSSGLPFRLSESIDFYILENVSSEGRITIKQNQEESRLRCITLLKNMIPENDYEFVKECIEYSIGWKKRVL